MADFIWKDVVWRQFNAAMDMFGKALKTCPDELWQAHMWNNNDPSMGPEFSEFWYVAYHALFWLDLYLGGSVDGFTPPAPFTLAELDPAGVLPERVYTRAELLGYLEHSREKCRTTLERLTDEKAGRLCSFSWGQLSFGELLLDNMRHLQEHGAQLNMLLGQETGADSSWASGAVRPNK